MARIEIRDSAQLVWRPGIDDLTGKASPFVLVNAFRIGSNVYGLGKGVVDVGFQPAHPMPEAELPAVVTAVANGTPAVQRSILRIVKLVRRGDAVDGGAGWKTEHVRLPQCPSLVVNPAVIHGIHILRRRGITGRNSQKLTWWRWKLAGTRSRREQVLPIWNRSHVLDRNPRFRSLREHGGRGIVIGARLRIANIQRLGQVFFLKQAMGKTPDVRGFDHEVVRQLSSNTEINHVGVWSFQLVVQAPGQCKRARG